MELGQAYADALPANHRQALAEAADMLIDTTLEALASSGDSDWSADDWYVGGLLPPRYIPRYTRQFAVRFFMCLSTVVWKLGQRDSMPPSCVAEELAAHALIEEAGAIMEMQGNESDFGAFEDLLFDDVDFEYLYDGSADGIEETDVGAYMGMTDLAFGAWFTRFGGPDGTGYTEVHPYARDDDDAEVIAP